MTLLFILHSVSGFNSGLEVRVLPGSPQFPPIFLELVLADKLALDAKLWFTLDLQNPQLVNREHAP